MDSRAPATSGRAAWSVPLTTAVAYIATTWLTEPVFVADTADMAYSAVARVFGRNCLFFEPGHFLWRPAGYATLELFGTARSGVQTEALIRASQVQLTWLAWVAGLIAIVCCAVWVHRRTGDVAATAVGAGVILISKAFLNYSQVGASYVPALACLLLALLLLSRDDAPPYSAIAAGALLGTSVLLWGTFALALPAALAAPLIFGTDRRRALRALALAIAGGSAVALVAVMWVSASLGFNSPDDLAGWAATADHGISVGGFPRAVLGFARSYLETGDYGKLVKRFLIGDSADPVSVPQLIGFPLVGILGFYLGLLLVLAIAWRARRRHAVFFVINAIPVALFAVMWQGGDLERYLPLVPGVALLVAAAFGAARSQQRVLILAWIGLMIVPNAITLGRWAVGAERDRVRANFRELETPTRSRLLIFSHWQDERVQLNRNYPPTRDPLGVRFYHLLTTGTPSVNDWRSRAAGRILGAWEGGAEVLVTERLLAATPEPHWDWVDGDDTRVRWSEFPEFFAPLTYGSAVGVRGDGFLPLPATPENRLALEAHRATAGQGRPPSCALPQVVAARLQPVLVISADRR
jgi:hypothetical protein